MSSTMNDKDLQAWLEAHGGEVSREDKEVIDEPANKDELGHVTPAKKHIETIITAYDKAKIIVRRNPGSEGPRPEYNMPYEENPESAATHSTYTIPGTEAAPRELLQPDNRSADQRAIDTDKAAMSAEERREAEWNRDEAPTAEKPNGRGSGFYETHEQRAAREQKIADQRREDARLELQREAGRREEERAARQQEIDARQAKNQEEATRQNQARIDEEIRHNQATEKGRPSIVGNPTDTTRTVSVFDPNTGVLTAADNPAYDAAKAQAEQQRQQIMLQIETGKLSLQEANAKYQQWFDTNIKLPFQQADEARQQAADSRAALDAEERRRQFAASFGLQKADLGERAGQHAAENEIALLPYRAGPDEAADMSSAINSLAAGGVVGGPSPSAGIHFQASDFEFNRPDFQKIAAAATKQAIGHLTPYRPAEGSFATASYGGINFPNAGTAAAAPPVPNVSIPYTPPAQPLVQPSANATTVPGSP
jgi:hypothetical protein